MTETYRVGVGVLQIMCCCVFVLAFVALVWRAVRSRSSDEKALLNLVSQPEIYRVVLLLSWLLLPPIFLYSVSHAWRPSWMPRYVLVSSIPLYLVVGCVVAEIGREKLRVGISGLLAGLLIAVGIVNTLQPMRAPCGAVVAKMRATADTPLDIRLFGASFELCNMIAQPMIFHLDEGEYGISNYSDGGLLLEHLKAAKGSPRPVFVVLIKMLPDSDFENFLGQQGLHFTRHYYDSRQFVTVYRIGQPSTEN